MGESHNMDVGDSDMLLSSLYASYSQNYYSPPSVKLSTTMISSLIHLSSSEISSYVCLMDLQVASTHIESESWLETVMDTQL